MRSRPSPSRRRARRWRRLSARRAPYLCSCGATHSTALSSPNIPPRRYPPSPHRPCSHTPHPPNRPMPLLRSLRFVPGDRPDRMEKARCLGAEALILDLAEAGAPDAKPGAREAVAAFLGTPRAIPLFVRINPLDSDFIADDLAAMLPAVPDGIVLPKAEGASSLKALDSWLPENMLILPIATETPAAIFSAGT